MSIDAPETRTTLSRRLAVAPMMDWTDRHLRFFLRLISARTLLYTEMVVDRAVEHGDRMKLLGFRPEEHPVALQLGGSEPERLATAAAIGLEHGYDEINLNVGCPSDRVRSGRFGACLMAEPALVADCVAAMREAVAGRVPVTVKTRIGIDDRDDFDFLRTFAESVSRAGADALIVHARKAWLQGLSPKENREKPPLDYGRVYRLKEAFPGLPMVINGGLGSLDDVEAQLERMDGAMLGRAAYHDPWVLADADRRIFGETRTTPMSRADVIHRFVPYVEEELARGTRLISITRHILGLFQGVPGARRWRRHLSEQASRRDAGSEVILEALEEVETTRTAA